MLTPDQICNTGAVLLGENRVNNTFTTNPQNKRERLCAENYDRIRLEMLSENIWNFAKRRGICQESPIKPSFGYNNAFFLPPDYHKLISIGEIPVWRSRPRISYSIEQHPLAVNNPIAGTQKAILIDADTLNTDDFETPQGSEVQALRITYVFNARNSQHFDIHFAKALGARLFKEIGPTLTEEQNRINRCEVAENEAMASALSTDAMETPPIELEEDSWIEVRF